MGMNANENADNLPQVHSLWQCMGNTNILVTGVESKGQDNTWYVNYIQYQNNGPRAESHFDVPLNDWHEWMSKHAKLIGVIQSMAEQNNHE